MSTRTRLILILPLFLLAGVLRLYQLNVIPPGLTHDEADHALDAAGVLEGQFPLYFSVGYGREPLYDYSTAPVMLILGRNYMASRVTAVLYGMALLVLTYAWARRATDNEWLAVALLAVMAIDFWPVSASREALRSITQPVLYMATALCLWSLLACAKNPPIRIFFTGLFLGLSFYTYLNARGMWAVFLIFCGYLAVWQRGVFRRVWPRLVAIAAIAIVITTPLVVYLRTHPETSSRLAMLSEPIEAFRAGDPGPLLDNIVAAPGIFTVWGDDIWLYNIPGRPLLWTGLGILFYVGLGLALVSLFCPWDATLCDASVFMLMTLLVGVVPVMLTGIDAANTRAIGLMPALYYFPALAVVTIGRWLGQQVGRWTAVAVASGYGLLLAITLSLTVRDYFIIWANARDVRVAYHRTLVETIYYLDAHPEIPTDVALSSITPDCFHDPSILQMMLRRGDLTVRWFDARSALIFPNAEASLLALPEITPLDPALTSLFEPYSEPFDRIELRPTDFNRVVTLWVFHAPAALANALAQAQTEVFTHPTDGYVSPDAPEQRQLPLQVGENLLLLGYQLHVDGGTVEVMTYWQVVAPTQEEIVLFTHAIDSASQVVGQQDLLGAPSANNAEYRNPRFLTGWREGDAFAQLHRFSLGEDAQPGAALIEIGAYTRPDIRRLVIHAPDGESLGSRVILGWLVEEIP